ncbi:DUF4372 domain-containing protein [Balneolaceae bacterium ANBcel3]|nr:DUF4372 domain-containing protein [Balneolaceae bacterium ANBcel3]
MNSGKTIFAQLMDVVPKYEFKKIVQRHHGNHRVRKLLGWDQFICICFGQLTFRHSLRDVTTTLNALELTEAGIDLGDQGSRGGSGGMRAHRSGA